MLSEEVYRTIRLPLHEIWENGDGEIPLFVTSDPLVAREHVKEFPEDTITTRWWVREGEER